MTLDDLLREMLASTSDPEDHRSIYKIVATMLKLNGDVPLTRERMLELVRFMSSAARGGVPIDEIEKTTGTHH
jgi:hypothetical protein